MPRSGPNGTYTLPGAQATQQPGTPIPSAVNNQGWSDAEQTFNTIQPIAYGGNGVADGKPLDNTFGVKNNADLTKIGIFSAADIPTATTLTYNLPKASGTLALTSDLGSISVPTNLALAASVAGNALTISIKGFDGNDPSASNQVVIPFRSATAASGDVDVLTLAAATSLVISSGSTLGTANAVAATLIVVAFNDAGTVRVGLINPIKGNLVLDGIGSSTAEGGAGGADTSGIFYTGTAVTSKAYTVLGYVTITEAIAGTWATAPTIVQAGGSAPTAFNDLVSGLPTFSCRAWVNFNGTGTVAIRSSGNVSSITDIGLGQYVVNFSVAMPDANYSVGGTLDGAGALTPVILPITYATGSVTVNTRTTSGGTSIFIDPLIANIQIFR